MKKIFLSITTLLIIGLYACAAQETVGQYETTANNDVSNIIEAIQPEEEIISTQRISSEPPVSSNETATPEKVYVKMYSVGTVNYRTGPSTTHKKIGTLSKGDIVKIVKDSLTETGWYEAKVGEQDCFVYAKYLSTTKPKKDSTSDSKDKTPTTGTSTGNKLTSGGSTTSNTGNTYVGPADPQKGVSWDGKSPIVYTYADGSTGTTPKVGATYESKPGITTTYTGYVVGSTGTGSVNGVFYCEHCGKVCGDGSKGTCVRWLTAGNHTCSHCGKTVPGGKCHTCN